MAAKTTAEPKLISKLDKNGKGKWEIGELIIYTDTPESAKENYDKIMAFKTNNPEKWAAGPGR